jgi:hypothetical protein
MRLNTIILIGIAFFFFVAIAQFKRIENLKIEKVRLSNNQETLLGEAVIYKNKDSLSVASASELSLKISDLEEYRARDLELIETLQVDNKRLEKIGSTVTKTEYVFKTVVRDSVIYIDSTHTETVDLWEYKDAWIDFKALVDSSGVPEIHMSSIDSLLYVEHVVPKKFLFFKWGVKSRRQEIVSRNPNTEIVSAEFITIHDR